jgi:hypothetical protein
VKKPATVAKKPYAVLNVYNEGPSANNSEPLINLVNEGSKQQQHNVAKIKKKRSESHKI